MNFTPRKAETLDSKVAEYPKVSKYMTRKDQLITFKPETPIEAAITLLLDKRISGAPVLDKEGSLVGLLSEKDCLRMLVDRPYHNQPTRNYTVGDFMSKQVQTIAMDDDIVDLSERFLNTNFRRFPVVNDRNHMVGQISRRDILRAIREIKPANWRH